MNSTICWISSNQSNPLRHFYEESDWSANTEINFTATSRHPHRIHPFTCRPLPTHLSSSSSLTVYPLNQLFAFLPPRRTFFLPWLLPAVCPFESEPPKTSSDPFIRCSLEGHPRTSQFPPAGQPPWRMDKAAGRQLQQQKRTAIIGWLIEVVVVGKRRMNGWKDGWMGGWINTSMMFLPFKW